MPQRDAIHDTVKQALIAEGWHITDDPYVITFGERFLFIDLGARAFTPAGSSNGEIIGAEREGRRIAVEIKELRGKSVIANLEQAIGQYILYRLLLARVDPDRQIYMAVTDVVYDEIFSEPIGELVITDLPLYLIVVDETRKVVQKWIPLQPIET